MTSPNGWHYAGVLPLPTSFDLSLSKDISSSPPGKAKLSASLTGIPSLTGKIDWVTVPDDNPGRPNGPTLEGAVAYVAYKLTRDETNGIPQDFGPCHVQENTDYSYEPFDFELRCDLLGSLSGESSSDGTESAIAQTISTVAAEKPTLVVHFDEGLDITCNLFVDPPGVIRLSSEFPGCGGKVAITR